MTIFDQIYYYQVWIHSSNFGSSCFVMIYVGINWWKIGTRNPFYAYVLKMSAHSNKFQLSKVRAKTILFRSNKIPRASDQVSDNHDWTCTHFRGFLWYTILADGVGLFMPKIWVASQSTSNNVNTKETWAGGSCAYKSRWNVQNAAAYF